MSPSTDTFGILELLEMILEYATPQDVLLWQRVNHMWHAVIQRSTPLQEKLYFSIKPCKNMTEQRDAVWNPFAERFFARSDSPNMSCLLIGNDTFSGKSNYPTASWKRMMMTSPAITWMRVYEFSCVHQGWSCTTSLACESGITIDKLAESLKDRNVNYAGYESGKLAGFAMKNWLPIS